LHIHLVPRDIHLTRPANGDHGRHPTLGALQGFEILEQLAIHPLTQGEELFSESPHIILDGKAFDLRAILSLQLDLERVLGEQLLLDHQRQVPDSPLNPQDVVIPILLDHHAYETWNINKNGLCRDG